MMYSEFIEGTGCKDNEKNYEVFKNLEVMYMNTNMTKQEVYEYGKKLVDNSKSEQELAFEAQIKEEIAHNKEMADFYKAEADRYAEYAKMESDKNYKKDYTDTAKYYRHEADKYRFAIKQLKWVLE